MTDHPSALVSVPVEPTEAMKIAGVYAIDNVQPNDVSMWVTACWSAMLAAAPAAPQSAGVGALDPLTVTLEWAKVETKALEEWRAEFGDYVALVTLGHDNVWAHRVNNTGSLHYKTADDAKAAALKDLRNRLSIRLHAARKAIAMYDRAPSREPEGGAVDDLVDRFAAALKDKLRAAEAKYGHDDAWMRDDWRDDLVYALCEHIEKGDPRDVAAYCAFAWHHGWSLALATREEAPAETTDCEKCAGNGEIVTDWDEYLSPPKGAPADHATADCPDCNGIGKVEAPAEAGEVECDGCDGDRCVYVGSLCNPSAQPQARSGEGQ